MMSKSIILTAIACILIAGCCKQNAMCQARTISANIYDLTPIGISFVVDRNNATTDDKYADSNNIINSSINANQRQASNSNDQQPQQQQQDFVKRTYSRSGNLDNVMQRQPSQAAHLRRQMSNDLWRQYRLNQVLDAISESIPTPATTPIYRSGRTYPPTGNSNNINQNYLADALQHSSSRALPVQANNIAPFVVSSDDFGPVPIVASVRSNAALSRLADLETLPSSGSSGFGPPKVGRATLKGLVWQQQQQQSKSVNNPIKMSAHHSTGAGSGRTKLSAHGSSSLQPMDMDQQMQLQLQRQQQPFVGLDGGGSPLTSIHHRSGTEEFALHTPIVSRSTNDIEWKRVEGSRGGRDWNNLRGMWGKRAINEQYYDDILNNDFKNKLEQQQQIESQQQQQPQQYSPSIELAIEGASRSAAI